MSSQKNFVNIGVPPGTILGPILFLLYVNDLSNSISNANINIYADDVVIYCSDSEVHTLKYKMQNVMDKVNNWYEDNKLSLSFEKCTTMVIGNNRQEIKENFDIYLGSHLLEKVHSMKYLGVLIDDKLKWKEHSLSVSKRININNARLRRIHKTVPQRIRVKIHKAISEPIIDYAATVWGHFSKHISNDMSRLEHMAARAITGNYDFINIRGSTLMSDLNLKPFLERHSYNTSLLAFKAIHNMVPDYISNSFTLSSEINERILRSSYNRNLYLPKPSRDIFKKSLSYFVPHTWNQLPTELKNSKSLAHFKCMYKKMFP